MMNVSKTKFTNYVSTSRTSSGVINTKRAVRAIELYGNTDMMITLTVQNT